MLLSWNRYHFEMSFRWQQTIFKKHIIRCTFNCLIVIQKIHGGLLVLTKELLCTCPGGCRSQLEVLSYIWMSGLSAKMHLIPYSFMELDFVALKRFFFNWAINQQIWWKSCETLSTVKAETMFVLWIPVFLGLSVH